MKIKSASLTLLFLFVGFPSYCPAQHPSRNSASVERRRSKEIEEARFRTARLFVERARTFQDLPSKTDTLINIASMLWRHPGDEQYAREIFLNIHDELRRAASSQSQLADPTGRNTNLRLQQRVARFVARHDPKLAQDWFEELISEDAAEVRARHQLDAALDLASDGETLEARRLAGKAVETNFASLEIGLLLNFLHRLRSHDQADADSLFIQALGKLTLQPQVTGEDLLLIGNYLFIADADVGSDSVRFTPIRVEDLYFPVGINGERTGVSHQLAKSYLVSALAILNRQLMGSELQFPRRYAAVARMLLLKAQKFAPELAGSFTALAREFSVSRITDFPAPSSSSSAKVVDYEAVKSSLDKLQGVARDERCLGLAATAYLQGDLDTAFKLAELLSDVSQRDRLNELIRVRRAEQYLEKDDPTAAEQSLPKLSTEELVIILELGLANLDIKNDRLAAALPRLQSLAGRVQDHEIHGGALYLLSSAALLGAIDAAAGMQVLVKH